MRVLLAGLGLLAASCGGLNARDDSLSQFARDRGEFWAMLTDMTGPLAPLIVGLEETERKQVLRAVADGIERFRVGDVLRIPAQAQLAWGET